MPSPFPGMDPYLEDPAYWSGFHTKLIVAIGAALTQRVPAGYYAEVEQHVWLEEDGERQSGSFGIPDAFLGTGGRGGSGGVAVLTSTEESLEVALAKPTKRKGHRYLQIVDKKGNRVVTVIELLSPSNKEAGEDRDTYIAKRNEYLAAGTNLVEIDLLRDGERIPMGRPRPPLADYYALVSRAERFPKASVWAFNVRDPLPRLPVPLKPQDGEVVLDLPLCFARAYEDGGYDNRLDYSQPPTVGLRAPDAVWAAELLKSHPIAEGP